MGNETSLGETIREWLGVAGGVIASITALVLWGRPVWSSFWPIRIVPLEPAHTLTYPSLKDAKVMEKKIFARVETFKRTSGPITSLTAYIQGMELIKLNLLADYHQPPTGIDEQSLTFGTLPDKDYKDKKLVIVAECRMRKGRLAIKKKISIKE
jgi:hypothetical protein